MTTKKHLSAFLFSAVALPLAAQADDPFAMGADERVDLPGEHEPLDAFAGIGFEEDVPAVLTATRLRQPKSHTPATVTVLEGDVIRSLGILNLHEVFRLVPGMTVAYTGSNHPVVSYHGTMAVEQRRLQVLVDGRSYYNASLADVDWNNIPVPMQAIERIEVTRGPNAAAYGANSFLAVINIITRSPQDAHGLEAGWTQGVSGQTGHRDLYGSVGGRRNQTDWQLFAQRRESDGFDFEDVVIGQTDEGNPITEKEPRNDGYELDTLNYRQSTELTPQDVFSLSLGFHNVFQEGDQKELGSLLFPASDPDTTGEDIFAQVSWEHEVRRDHFFELMAYHQMRDRRKSWQTCPDDEAAQEVFGLPMGFCTTLNEDLEEQRTHVEFQETRRFEEWGQIVYGASYREERYTSDTFFNGTETNHLTQVFGNLERRMTDWLTFNFGAMWEKEGNAGNFVSPRGAASFHISPNQTLRFVVSRAHRLPDSFERDADWAYRINNVEPEGPLADMLEGERSDAVGFGCCEMQNEALGLPPLEEETITSRELSYVTSFRRGQGLFNAEAKIFRDSLSQIISGRTNIDNWDLENAVDITQKGFELEASADLPRNFLRLSYAYLDADSEYSGSAFQDDPEGQERAIRLQSRMNARHSGSAAWIHELPRDVKVSGAYYLANSLRDRRFERMDLRLAKSIYMRRTSIELAAVYQRYLNSKPLYRKANNRADRNHIFAQASVRF